MKTRSISSRSIQHWFRLVTLLVALGIVVWSIRYLNSGGFQKSPEVQSFMNPEGDSGRTAKIVFDRPTAAKQDTKSDQPPLKDH